MQFKLRWLRPANLALAFLLILCTAAGPLTDTQSTQAAPTGSVILNVSSLAKVTAMPSSDSLNPVCLQVQAVKKGTPVEVSYLVLDSAGTPDSPSSGITTVAINNIASAAGNAYAQTEVAGWARPEYRANPKTFIVPSGKTCVMLLARYDKLYVIFMREEQGNLSYRVLNGRNFNSLNVPNLGTVKRVGSKLEVKSTKGSPIEVGIWYKGTYKHDEVNGWAQESYKANPKYYEIPKYGMFMMTFARYGRMGVIIGNYNDGRLGAVTLTGSKLLSTATIPGLGKLINNGGGNVAIIPTGSLGINTACFGYNNTSWHSAVSPGAPLSFTLPHYTPGFMMCANTNKGSIFFFNENDGQTGIIQVSGIITKKIAAPGQNTGGTQNTQGTQNNQNTQTTQDTQGTQNGQGTQNNQTTGQLTVAGFQVVDFQGTVNTDGSFAGSGKLVIPGYNTVNATFRVDKQGHVLSGSWNGSFSMGPKVINISSGTITDAGLKAVYPVALGGRTVNFNVLVAPGSAPQITYSGSLGPVLKVNLAIGTNGTISGTGSLTVLGMNLTMNLSANDQGQITGTTSVANIPVPLPGGTISVKNATFTVNPDLTVSGSGEILLGNSKISDASFTVQSDGSVKGNGAVSIGGVNVSVQFNLSLSNFSLSGSANRTASVSIGPTSYSMSAKVSLGVVDYIKVKASASGTVQVTAPVVGTKTVSVSGAVDLASGKITVKVLGVDVTFDLF